MTTLTLRCIKGDFVITGPDIEPIKFTSRREAKDWCRRHHPRLPVVEIGRDASTQVVMGSKGRPRREGERGTGQMPIIAHSDSLFLHAEGHLFAAVRFSDMVAAEETEGKDQRLIRDYDTACVFAAVAALESYANELFFQPQTTFPEHSAKLLAEIWELSERKPIIDKFNLALRIKNQPTFDEKQSPTKNVVLLIDLRNALVHFKPAWNSEAAQHRRLSDKLRGKFEPSKILKGPTIFPYSWPTVGCTEWAIDTVQIFSEHFAKRFKTVPERFLGVAAERARNRRI